MRWRKSVPRRRPPSFHLTEERSNACNQDDYIKKEDKVLICQDFMKVGEESDKDRKVCDRGRDELVSLGARRV